MTLTLTLVFWLLIVAIVLLVAWLVYLGHSLGNRIGAQEDWAHQRDPEHFGIYPDLEPEPPARDCEARGSMCVYTPGSDACRRCGFAPAPAPASP